VNVGNWVFCQKQLLATPEELMNRWVGRLIILLAIHLVSSTSLVYAADRQELEFFREQDPPPARR